MPALSLVVITSHARETTGGPESHISLFFCESFGQSPLLSLKWAGGLVSIVGLSWLTSEEPLLRILPEVTRAWRASGKATAESVNKVLIRFLRRHNANTNSKGPVARSRCGWGHQDFETRQSSEPCSSLLRTRDGILSSWCSGFGQLWLILICCFQCEREVGLVWDLHDNAKPAAII